MSERYNLLINADRSIIEHSHGANYTTKFQEQVRKRLLERCFLEMYLADPWKVFVPFDLNQFKDQIFERFKETLNIDLITHSRIDWNEKDGQESDYYKDEILRLVEEGKIDERHLSRMEIDWNRKDGQESDFYKDKILRLCVERKIIQLSGFKINWNRRGNQES